MKKTTITIAVLLSLSAPLAFASDHDRDDRDDHCHGRHCVSAFEIDPAQAMGALTLLGGTMAIIRGRRKK